MTLNPHLVARIDRAVTFYGAGTPTAAGEARALLTAIGVTAPQTFLDFVARWGGCYCGVSVHAWHNASLLGAETCVELTLRARTDFASADEQVRAVLADGLVVADDGSGNPILLDAAGQVRLVDHDNGGIATLAADFETFLAENVDDTWPPAWSPA